MKNNNFDYNEEVTKCKTIDDVMGKNCLIKKLVKDILENILKGEMEEYFGRSKYQHSDDENWNGYSKKNLRSSFGDVDLNIPRDRNREFKAKIIKKYKTVFNKNNIFIC